MGKTPILLSVVLCAASLLRCSAAIGQEKGSGTKQNEYDRVGEAYAQMVEARLDLLNYALALQNKYGPSTTEYAKGRDLYVAATRAWAGWSAIVVIAVEAGRAKNLNNKAYREKAEDAGLKTQAFFDYAQEKTGTGRGGVVDLVAKIVSIGLDIYNGTRPKDMLDRKNIADKINEQGTKWPLWDEMKQQKKEDNQSKQN